MGIILVFQLTPVPLFSKIETDSVNFCPEIVYTNKNDAPAYDNRIIEIENEYIAPTNANTVASYFIPVDVSNFITIRHFKIK